MSFGTIVLPIPWLKKGKRRNFLTNLRLGLEHTNIPQKSANKGLPLPLGRGVCKTKSKNGRAVPRKPFISRVFCAQRGIETMVSDHGLGRGQTMG